MLTSRDQLILQHVGLYTISIRRVIEQQFFAGMDCENVIARLLVESRIRANGGVAGKIGRLPGGISYYQLTPPEADRIGVPHHRTKQLPSAVLPRLISVLWFCTMTNKKRRRLERYELKNLFGAGTNLGTGLGVPHVLELSGERKAILRVYTPGHVKDRAYARSLAIDAERAAEHAGLAPWIRERNYRFVVLVDSPAKQKRLQHVIERVGVPIEFSVELAPSVQTLHTACKETQHSE